jgi:hypothetical protein
MPLLVGAVLLLLTIVSAIGSGCSQDTDATYGVVVRFNEAYADGDERELLEYLQSYDPDAQDIAVDTSAPLFQGTVEVTETDFCDTLTSEIDEYPFVASVGCYEETEHIGPVE